MLGEIGMTGEVGLSKATSKDPLSYIVADVNDAMRRMYLSRALIVIGRALSGVSAANAVSDTFELPGRNNFTVQIATASGSPTAHVVKLQGSLTGSSSSGDWVDVGASSAGLIGLASYTDNRPFRFYRLFVSTGVTGGTIDAHLSAIGY